jgi:hypothetical protein
MATPCKTKGDIAQLVERCTCNADVISSNLIISTKKKFWYWILDSTVWQSHGLGKLKGLYISDYSKEPFGHIFSAIVDWAGRP